MHKSKREGAIHALLVGNFETDRTLLRDVFQQSGWRLTEARDQVAALETARRQSVQVILAETNGWRELLDALHQVPSAPPLVVCSHQADDYLWSEVLNRGGFDVLPRPFDRDELYRVIAAASRSAVAIVTAA